MLVALSGDSRALVAIAALTVIAIAGSADATAVPATAARCSRDSSGSLWRRRSRCVKWKATRLSAATGSRWACLAA